MLIRGISGVRGLTSETLTPEVVIRYARAFEAFLGPGVLVLGRDGRPSGRDLGARIRDELLVLGRNVIECGIVPTPTIQFLTENLPAAGGLIVTASHNPAEWNGLKFVRPDGTFLHPEECRQLFQNVDEGCASRTADRKGKLHRQADAIERHVRRVISLDCIDPQAVRERAFTVVVDAVNAAGSRALPALLEALGCRVIKLYCEGDGNFRRGTEPLPHNLRDLGAAVRKHGAAVGFAVDPDADRLAVVAETGEPLGEEYTLVLAAEGYWKTTGRGTPLVANLSTTMALDDLARQYGTSILRSAVGEINVVQMMQSTGAPLGGEGNGGVILAQAHLGRDSLVGAAMILQRLVLEDQPLSAIAGFLPRYEMLKDKVSTRGLNLEAALDKVRQLFREARIDRTDGVKFIWEDRWVQLRRSNTEPILRIYAEARSAGEAQSLVDTVKNALQS